MSNTEGEPDVNDFLQRIKELGNRRDQEDEDRTRKLEEEILQGRKERQARRAERALSISPTKLSPISTPTRPISGIISSSDDQSSESQRESVVDNEVDEMAMNAMPDFKRTSQIRDSPSNAMPSRNSPLSWARRPEPSDKLRSRPLSMVATDRIMPSRTATLTPDNTTSADDSTLSREQIAQSLASKDPVWFRQTADRGVNSPAYRKNQVEDEERAVHEAIQMPGMTGNNSTHDRAMGEVKDTSSTPSRSPTRPSARNSISFGSGSRMLYQSNPGTGMGSPLPMSDVQRLDPPATDNLSEIRGLAMSPSQGRISPDRTDRPVSPTKGMGGFVQSAMMKRSESMNKRWSVQSPSLDRKNTSFDPYLDNTTTSPSRPTSRPTSSHGELHRPETASSMRSSVTNSTVNDGSIFSRPSLATTRSYIPADAKDADNGNQSPPVDSLPASPTKTMDPRRWSPTKSSWLESALNKPESPKPKATPPPQQPSWMSEISRAKQRGSVDIGRSQTVKHEVNIGGLMRSPPPGAFTRPSSIRGFATAFSPGVTPQRNIESMINQDSKNAAENTKVERSWAPSTSTPILNSTPKINTNFTSIASATPKANLNSPVGPVKLKPVTPPKKDFRSVLKSRQVPADEKPKEEPEFKNVFGQLRRTKTQSYIAPDAMKDNITRGKAGLNLTGGPIKTERKDEFKDAILKKKEDFKKVQTEGNGVTRSASGESQDYVVPEALRRRNTLKSNGSVSNILGSPLESSSPQRIASANPTPNLVKEASAPERIQEKIAIGGKLAGRLNPALADLLARGPPSLASEASRSSSPSMSQRPISMSTSTNNPESAENGPHLTHMTKGRARGPKRKAPSAAAPAQQAPVPKTEDIEEPRAASPIKSLAASERPSSPAISPIRQTISALNTEQPQESTPTSQPSSPKKLDMRRRSLFLQEAPKNKDTPSLEAPKPLSPVKIANFPENTVKAHHDKFEAPISPDPSKPEPPAPAKSPSPTKVYEDRAFNYPISPETAKLCPAPLSPRKANSMKAPPQFSPHADQPPPLTPSRSRSVKHTAALWGRSTPEQPARIPSPIKLPTHEDEKAAFVGAGLRPTSPMKRNRSHEDERVALVGVGLPPISPLKRNKSIDLGLRVGPRSTIESSSARPLPTPPTKNLTSPVMSPGLRSPSMAYSPVPQASEASQLLADFFGDEPKPTPTYSVDTASILMARQDTNSAVQTIQSSLFCLFGDGKKKAVPTHQERVLFEREMYICPHTFTDGSGRKVTEVYWWIGDEVPGHVVSSTEIFARREAKGFGGSFIRLRQGKESPEFYQALGGIIIVRRGSSNKYDSLAPHVLCARQQHGMLVFDEVDYSPSVLCSGFPYIISSPSGKIFLWKGRGSTVEEHGCARLLGMEISMTGEIEEVEDGDEPSSFLELFDNCKAIPQSADHWKLKPAYNKYSARLFCASTSGEEQIFEINPFCQADLSSSSIFILDAFFEIYIVIGAKAQSQYGAFHNALQFVQEYGILSAGMEDRPFVPVSTVVIEGIPKDLKSVFRKWDDGRAPTIVQKRESHGGTGLKRARSLRVVPLTAALEAVRG
ncbi:hypothetical protein DSL72_007740 [Monilinia vaccinii-corymbosi]|uniref:DUF4045 domain-containing protein n=1 Tax=Monilinia vaccinii-corymbosi TaxID=61207 RepID=A0A8A3PIL3_9HELO|nr:hypothetical protein DSL72_007740 [Monilinia vaccinii-corymbosi]